MLLGEKIRAYRKENKITQKELAAKIGIARSTLAEMETGKIKGKISNIRKLADITNTQLNYWIDAKEITVAPYDFLDTFLEMLISEDMIKEDGKIPEPFKDSLLAIIEKELLLKIERKKNNKK